MKLWHLYYDEYGDSLYIPIERITNDTMLFMSEDGAAYEYRNTGDVEDRYWPEKEIIDGGEHAHDAINILFKFKLPKEEL